MITMNTPCILKGNQVQFTVFRLTDVTFMHDNGRSVR